MSEAIQKSNVVALAPAWTQEQRDLIRRTVAKDCTDDELSMFLHVANKSQLDPLLRQIHCTKLGGRLAFIADINGLQARAAREADYMGIKHAVVYEKDDFQMDHLAGTVTKHVNNPLGNNGRIIGAWAIVERKGMLPFVSVVSFEEYLNPNNSLWKTKPRVMIDKCAKSTALRLAYPEQLGNIYEEAELGKEERELNPEPPPTPGARTAKVRAEVVAQVAAKLSAPKVSVVDVATGETEAQAEQRQASTPWQKVSFLMLQAGKSGKAAADFLKGVTGKSDRKALTEEDVSKVQDALDVLRAEAGAEEVPPPSDSDFPPQGAEQ